MESNVAAELPLSHKALAWFEHNRKQALWAVAGAAVVVLVVCFVVWQRGVKEAQASQALSDVMLAQAGFAGPSQESAQPYLKIVADHPNSSAAARALLLAAGALFNQGKYSEAEAQFQRFTRDYRESPFLGEALLGIASCLDAQGKTDQAVTAYKDLISRHPADAVIPHARFALARLYEAQNKPEMAKDLYEQVERDGRYTSMGSEAGMRVEELIQKFPNLAPPPAPTPSPISLMPTPAMSAPTGAVAAPVLNNAPAPTPKK